MHYDIEDEFHLDDLKQHYFDSRKYLMRAIADNLALISSSLKLQGAMKSQLIRDPLTDLVNRRYMEESLDHEIARCERASKGIGVIFVDLDHFKQVNDRFGYDAGDAVIAGFARFLAAYFRQSDIVCRFDGEAFVVVMPEAQQSLVVERATQLCYKLQEVEFHYDGNALPTMTASFGVAYLPGNDYKHASIIVTLASAAREQAKKTGRNQVVVHDNDDEINEPLNDI